MGKLNKNIKKIITAGRRLEIAVPDEVMTTAGFWDPRA
jgi:hypothetical protein